MKSHDGKKAKPGTPMDERLMLHVRKDENGCWLWTAHTNNKGYGKVMVGGKSGKLKYAHRVSYETFVGPIPAGLEIDHLCRVPSCINPAHLEPVTPQENTLRGNSPGARALRRENCLHGHPYSEHGHVSAGRRICLVCRDAYQRLHKAMPYAEIGRRKREGIPVVDLAAYFAENEQASA